ncbi:MAG: carbohydrate kinase family protein [Marmoricola sp.]|nr:carbohydrate kinase family protein [Marmoricola sp.]
MTDVLVLGDANPDLILRGDVVPRFEQAEQLLSGADVVLGGSAAIMAHGLARLGRSVQLVATTGADAFGYLVARMLAEAGVRSAGIARDPRVRTGVTVVLSTPEDRAVLTYAGAIPVLDVEQAGVALEAAVRDGARHVHAASFFLLPQLAAGLPGLFARAHEAGLTTSLDTNYDPAGSWAGVEPVLDHLDLLFPNRAEVLALAGRLGHEGDDVASAAARLAERGPTVVVKEGAEGAVSVAPDGVVLREAGCAVEAVDTTGAGDTFDAAFVDSFLRGLEPAECLRRACVAGALSTAGVGGTSAQPTIDQLTPGGAEHAPRHA